MHERSSIGTLLKSLRVKREEAAQAARSLPENSVSRAAHVARVKKIDMIGKSIQALLKESQHA